MVGSEQQFLMFLGDCHGVLAGDVSVINVLDNSVHLQSRLGINRLNVTVGLCRDNKCCMELIMSGGDVANILGLASGLDLGLQFGDWFVDWILVRVCIIVVAPLLEWSGHPQFSTSRLL